MVAVPKLLLLWLVLFYVVVALPALFAPDRFKKVIDRFVKNEDMIRLASFVTFIFGFLFLLVYARLDGTRYMLFSILGYLCLIKAIVNLRFPAYAVRKAKWFYGSK